MMEKHKEVKHKEKIPGKDRGQVVGKGVPGVTLDTGT